MLSNMSILLCAVLALGRLAAGMNVTYAGNCTASDNSTMNFYDGAPWVNAKGVAKFTVPKLTGDQLWHYILTLTDETSERQEIGRFLAMPESAIGDNTKNYTHLCAFTLDGAFDSPKAGQGNETCDGIVSDQCTEELFHSVDFEPSADCYVADLNEHCGSHGWKTSSIKLAKDMSCMATSLPGVDLPKGYRVASLGPAHSLHKTDDDHSVYDRFVQEARPLVLEFVDYTDLGRTSYSYDLVDAQRICAAPDQVKNGSRVPTPTPDPTAESTPDPSSEGIKTEASLLAAIAMLFALFL